MSLFLTQGRIRGHPELSLLGFDLAQLSTIVRRDFPTLASRKIEIWVECQPTLACVTRALQLASGSMPF